MTARIVTLTLTDEQADHLVTLLAADACSDRAAIDLLNLAVAAVAVARENDDPMPPSLPVDSIAAASNAIARDEWARMVSLTKALDAIDEAQTKPLPEPMTNQGGICSRRLPGGVW